MESKEEKLTLTVKEAGKLLGIAELTAYRAVHSGDIPAFKIGNKWIISKSAFENMLLEKRHTPLQS